MRRCHYKHIINIVSMYGMVENMVMGTIVRYSREGEFKCRGNFFASDEAIYVTGAILPIDGGYTAV